MNSKWAILALVIGMSSLAGCFSSRSTTMVQGTTTISKGEELQELQRALGEGAITQSEYDRLRAVILKRPN